MEDPYHPHKRKDRPGHAAASTPQEHHDASDDVDLSKIRLSECFWIDNRTNRQAPLSQEDIDKAALGQSRALIQCVPAPAAIVAFYRWVSDLLDSGADELPSICFKFSRPQRGDVTCVLEMPGAVFPDREPRSMQISGSGLFQHFMVVLTQGIDEPNVRDGFGWWISMSELWAQAYWAGSRSPQEVPEAVITLGVVRGRLHYTFFTPSKIKNHEYLPGPVRGAFSRASCLRTILKDIIEHLRSSVQLWQPGGMDDDAGKALSGNAVDKVQVELARHEIASASLARLVETFTPKAEPSVIVRIEEILHAAQIEPPSDKAAFVRDINELLDVFSLRIATEDGGAGRLSLNSSGTIRITRAEGGTRGFKRAVLSLVPVDRTRVGNRFTATPEP